MTAYVTEVRNGSGILHELATTTAVHVSDFDHHVRAVRAATAELRDRVAVLRTQLADAAVVRERQLELQRALGQQVLGAQRELDEARVRADEHLAAIDAAADEEVRQIREAALAQAALLQRAIDTLVGYAEPAEVVPFAPRPLSGGADADETDVDRSVAM